MLSKFINIITIIFILAPINISFSQTPENFIINVTTKASEILTKNIEKYSTIHKKRVKLIAI